MASRTKKKTIANVSLETAQEASRVFAMNQNKLAGIEADMNKKINDVKSKYQDQITELKDMINEPLEVLEVYAKEQQASWGKKKSMELLHCIIGFRTGTPKVDKNKKFTWDAVTELLSKNKVFKSMFIRSKEEINKEAILALPDDDPMLQRLSDECYITVKQDESFFVTAKTEEVAK